MRLRCKTYLASSLGCCQENCALYRLYYRSEPRRQPSWCEARCARAARAVPPAAPELALPSRSSHRSCGVKRGSSQRQRQYIAQPCPRAISHFILSELGTAHVTHCFKVCLTFVRVVVQAGSLHISHCRLFLLRHGSYVIWSFLFYISVITMKNMKDK